MKSVYIVNIPQYDADTVPLGPAILQKVAKDCGYKTYFSDLNLELDVNAKNQDFKARTIWSSTLTGHLPYSTVKYLIKLIDNIIDKAILVNSDFVAISFFSFVSLPYGKLFLKRLQTKKYKGKTIIGGPGISRNLEIAQQWLDNKLTDYYVTGDGEIAFEKILCDKLPYPGVNNPNNIAIGDMNSLYFPDFEHFDLDLYPKMFGQRTLGIEGSRGCVRDCGFCDIKVLFLKYRYKSGQRLFDEIMYNIKQYGVYVYWFTDSLVNGNQKEFRTMLRLLSEYNKNVDEHKKVKWTGQYIIRPQKQYIDEDFQLLVDSGCLTLATGIESYSEKVRRELGKNFSNDDINWFFHKCQKYGISLFILMVVGYPTETHKDFEESLRFFDDFEHLSDDKTISGVQLGNTMNMIPGTPVWRDRHNLEIEYDYFEAIKHVNSWKNKNSDLKIRVRRRLLAQKYAIERGWGTIIRSTAQNLDMFKRWAHDL